MENEGRLFAKKSQSEEKSPSQIDYTKANLLLKELKQLLDERISHIKKSYPSLPGAKLIAFEQLFKLSSAMNLKDDLSPVNRAYFARNIKRIVNSFDINQLTIQEDLSFYNKVITELHNIMQAISNEKIVFPKEEKPTWQDLAKKFHIARETLHGFVKRGITSDDIDTVLATCESYIVFIENQAMSPEILDNGRNYLLVIKNLISKLRPKDEVGNYFRLSGLARSEHSHVANDDSDDNDGSLFNFLQMIKKKAAEDTTEIPDLNNSESDEEKFQEGDKDSLKKKNPEQRIEKNKVEIDFKGANKTLVQLKNKIEHEILKLQEIIDNLKNFPDSNPEKEKNESAHKQLAELVGSIAIFSPLTSENIENFHTVIDNLGEEGNLLTPEDAEFYRNCRMELSELVVKTMEFQSSSPAISHREELNYFVPNPKDLNALQEALYLAIPQLLQIQDPNPDSEINQALKKCEAYLKAIEAKNWQALDQEPNMKNGSKCLFDNIPEILPLILAVVPQKNSKVDPREEIMNTHSYQINPTSYQARRQLSKSTHARLQQLFQDKNLSLEDRHKLKEEEPNKKQEQRYRAKVVTATIAEATPTILSPTVTNLLQRDLSKILKDNRAAEKENEPPKEIVEGDDVESNDEEDKRVPPNFY